MKLQVPEKKQSLIKRLKRIEGQIRGVENMLEEERDCRAIMQQLTAISSAVKSTSREFFKEYASVCLQESDPSVNPQEMIEEMMNLMEKTP